MGSKTEKHVMCKCNSCIVSTIHISFRFIASNAQHESCVQVRSCPMPMLLFGQTRHLPTRLHLILDVESAFCEYLGVALHLHFQQS